MSMLHIHVGLLRALETFAHVIIIGFFWRWLAMRYHKSAAGKAMAFVY